MSPNWIINVSGKQNVCCMVSGPLGCLTLSGMCALQHTWQKICCKDGEKNTTTTKHNKTAWVYSF